MRVRPLVSRQAFVAMNQNGNNTSRMCMKVAMPIMDLRETRNTLEMFWCDWDVHVTIMNTFCDAVTSEPQTALDTVTHINTNSVENEEEMAENTRKPTTPMMQMPSWPTIPRAKNLDFLSWSTPEKGCNFSKQVCYCRTIHLWASWETEASVDVACGYNHSGEEKKK